MVKEQVFQKLAPEEQNEYLVLLIFFFFICLESWQE